MDGVELVDKVAIGTDIAIKLLRLEVIKQLRAHSRLPIPYAVHPKQTNFPERMVASVSKLAV